MITGDVVPIKDEYSDPTFHSFRDIKRLLKSDKAYFHSFSIALYLFLQTAPLQGVQLIDYYDSSSATITMASLIDIPRPWASWSSFNGDSFPFAFLLSNYMSTHTENRFT